MIKPISLSKPIISKYSQNTGLQLCSLKTQNEVLGDIFVSAQKAPEGDNRFIMKIKNKLDKLFGYEVFSINPYDENKIFGFYINVDADYRNKKAFKFGELLRLSSIIEVMENNAKSIQIYSKESAVYFHSKYKFVPCICRFDERDMALKAIIKNDSKGMEKYTQAAKELVNRIKTDTDRASQKRFYIETNNWLRNYIAEIISIPDKYRKYPFSYGMEMILTKERILENREFFNSLFLKRGIDYQI